MPMKKNQSIKIPKELKWVVQSKADLLVEKFKTNLVRPPPTDHQFNYIVDIFTKWRGRSFYFCKKYCCPGPDNIHESFDVSYLRFEYAGERNFNLSFMRHTGKWAEVYTDVELDECFRLAETEEMLMP
jgi:hypothetical protein